MPWNGAGADPTQTDHGGPIGLRDPPGGYGSTHAHPPAALGEKIHSEEGMEDAVRNIEQVILRRN
jgi:hypothetical protein